MTAPMTPARLEEIRFAIERAKSDADREDLHPDDDINHVVGLELLEEIDRLRALPVLRTCGPCRHWRSGTSFIDEPDTTRCSKTMPSMPIDINAAPPPTCPLRGRGQ